ncbi:SDR family oxidoreductase [Nocardioides sp. GY 10113]|uniref:SDR family NAD(P)-dependent oxidoreductase n=1 Tax=Nocardioides sp. GY 10113 TaxID=2569761 RepID=UPI0010A82935|nr:SDR family oxidoreductase [Nocardioides sp. GY 10113]TIC85059.1 SDR family oxidoreductase [Nocardioides sp. GY 10113]
MGRLQDRVAVVTGGAAGIGRAIVETFADEGARVVLVDRELDGAAGLLEAYGDRVAAVRGDVAERATAEAAVAEAVARFGSLSVLVTCAQGSVQKPFLEQSVDDLEVSLRSGLHQTWHFLQVAHPHLRVAGGSVITFASGAGLDGMPTQSSYAAAKEAIRGLSRTVANEWARDGIRVNTICPIAATEGVQRWAAAFPDDYARSAAKVPMGRWGDPRADVAPIVLFLASDDSRYMTGQTLMADGGSIKLR